MDIKKLKGLEWYCATDAERHIHVYKLNNIEDIFAKMIEFNNENGNEGTNKWIKENENRIKEIIGSVLGGEQMETTAKKINDTLKEIGGSLSEEDVIKLYKDQVALAGWEPSDKVLDRLSKVDYADGYHRDGEYEFILLNKDIAEQHCRIIELIGVDFQECTHFGWEGFARYLLRNK